MGTQNVYESVCALLIQYGGYLFLGVKDNGVIIGIDGDSVEQLKKDFVTSLNNPQTLNPTFYMAVEDIEVNGKVFLRINVPESSQSTSMHAMELVI